MADSGQENHRQRYRMREKIDAGGMAEVYLADAESIEGISRQVAIKRVLPNLTANANFMGMFLDEARLSTQLTHANIVQVFDVGRSGESMYIVMEFVDGFNLRRIFQKAVEAGYCIPLEIACYVMTQVCEGLAHAHEKRDTKGNHLRIVHRDLSPPNVLVSRSGEVKITDFGLAKAITQSNITDPGIVKGKFSYLSPEACHGHAVDHRADIFSAGIVMWELLSRRRLFMGKTDADTVELVKACKIPALSKFHPSVTPEFERIIGRALEADPQSRYTSAREFGEALTNYLFSRNLKVTGYDLSSLIERLFGTDRTHGVEAPETRIASLIQEEILNLSMLGKLNAQSLDGSKPLDPGDLLLSTSGQSQVGSHWPSIDALAGQARAGNTKRRGYTKTADRLFEMLEGESQDAVPDDSESGPSNVKKMVIGAAVAIGVIVVLVLVLGGGGI
jgi:eukaryotic-like serine/threonine-protein kinase